MRDFLTNAWYMVAWAEEVTDEFLSRKFLGAPVLLTRDAAGAPIALRDRCPHRFAPLSLGKREGDTIVCGYHGLAFDHGGRCVRNPFSGHIPAAAAVASFRVVERDDIVWCWFGEAALADPALIPDFSATTVGPEGTRINGCTMVNANYEYATDNLLDLSHIEFLHTGSFAGNGVIFAGKHSVEQTGDRLRSNWWMPGVACPTGLDRILQTDIVDHWLDMRWDAPANMYLQVGATPPGEPREAGATFDQVHILTPADVGETYYFWSSNTRYPLPAEHAEQFREVLRLAFAVEDKPMIEAAYRNVEGDFWDQKPVSLGVDSGGTRARRIIERMKRDEAAGTYPEEVAANQ